MKRLWLGAGILLILLALGIFACAAIGHFESQVAQHLDAATNAAQAGNWQQAETAFLQAKKIWEQARSGNAAITDHAPMEEIDQYFAQGMIYLSEVTRKDFLSCCLTLKVLVQAVAEAQSISWWSIF